MEILNEVIKYCLPSLTLFAVVYYFMKTTSESKIKEVQMANHYKFKDRNDSMKIQAFERLILLCDRIDLKNLFFRLNTGNLTGKQIQALMMVGMQQEYDHNITQQLYISPQLWEIITLAKNQAQHILSECENKLKEDDDAFALLNMIIRIDAELNINPINHARVAIKNEFDLILS
jgi:hypothetical protein